MKRRTFRILLRFRMHRMSTRLVFTVHKRILLMLDNNMLMLVANSLVLLVDNSLVMHYRRLLLMVNSLLKDSRIILNQILLMHDSLVIKCKLMHSKGED